MDKTVEMEAQSNALGESPKNIDEDWKSKIAVAREARELGSALRKDQPPAEPLRYNHS
jgi:hypothetical protein